MQNNIKLNIDMYEVGLIFISQFLMIFFKHYNVRVISGGKTLKASVVGVLIQGLWLISSSLGIKAVLSFDWSGITAYLLAGFLGSLMNFRFKI